MDKNIYLNDKSTWTINTGLTNTGINKLVLVDQKDGSKWDIYIHGGELIYEPHELSDKRNFRIDRIIS